MRLNHIRRVISGFVIVVAAYWAYTVIAVPWIEPQVRRKTTRADARTQAPSTNRYRAELSRLFPPGSWELDNPKVLKSEQATLLLQKYRTLPNGRLELKPCTVVFYLSKAEREDNRRRTLILQAPEGAVLAFDGPLNLRQANMGSAIRPIGGQLVGPVRIRSTGLQPSNSDLQIDTSNVQITQQRILTREAVTFQMGPNRGSGRDLMLTLSEKATEGNVKDRLLGGLKIVELQHLESLQLQLQGDIFSSDDTQPATSNGVPVPAAPVEVTCDGPLRIDLQGLIATLEQGVRLQRLNPDTAPDRLECERLSLHFSKTESLPDDGADATRRFSRTRPAICNQARCRQRQSSDHQRTFTWRSVQGAATGIRFGNATHSGARPPASRSA